MSPKRKCLCFLFKSFNNSLQILAYDRPIRSKKLLIGGHDVAVIGVFVPCALVKSVLKCTFKIHHLQLYFNSKLRAMLVSFQSHHVL